MVTVTPSPGKKSSRDPYADFLRSFSLLVVICWHWCFTILIWHDNGPMATSPLGFTSGLWIATWLLQILPIFFYIGAYVHLKAWERAQARGDRIWHFALNQAKALAIPSGALLITWVILGVVAVTVFNVTWMATAVVMVVSPLWFVATYLVLICLLPITVWLHRRYDALVLVVLAGLSVLVDILRFRYDIPYVEWANMVFVWGFAFQLGFFHGRISGLDVAPRGPDGQVNWADQSPAARQRGRLLALTGLFALVGLVFSGLYPGSMVGVPGQGSNMAPPTVCIIALTSFQVGVAELIRPFVLRHLGSGGFFSRIMVVITRFALPLFLFHTTGMALSWAVEWTIFGNRTEAVTVDWFWWVTRPVAVVGPLLATLPVIWLFGRRYTTRAPKVRRRGDRVKSAPESAPDSVTGITGRPTGRPAEPDADFGATDLEPTRKRDSGEQVSSR